MSKTKILYKNVEKMEIDEYIILETIGEGTFGKVKLGIHKPTKQEVAIKIYEKKNFISSKNLFLFKKEISILKKLNHPNVIKIYNIIEDELNYYIIMEYASKGELFNYIVSKKKLEENEASSFYCQLIYGIEFIHEHGITHRDLKPENLLIKDNNILTIIDFGLSNEYSKNQLLSTPCGSPSYAAPEMILGNKYNGLSTDIWSSGIILYAMVCGHLPFEDKDRENLYKKILTCNCDLPNFLSENCKDLIKKILCVNEKKRIDINGIKNHPFLIESFNKYNPNEYMHYNPNKIYNKIIEIMVNNLSEYNYNKEEIIYSIKNKKLNNITTTYELLLKKIFSEENENKSNLLFIKSSTDSFVTTSKVSNLISNGPFGDKKIKVITKKNIKRQNLNNSNNNLKKENTDMTKESLSLSIQGKMGIEHSNQNKIFSYYNQTSEQFSSNNKKKVSKRIFNRTNYKRNKYESGENDNNKYYKINSNNITSKFRIYSNSNENFSIEENNNNSNNTNNKFNPFFSFNSISSREISKYKNDININKTNDKTNTINAYSNQKILKISNDFEDNNTLNHKQNFNSNEICDNNVSEFRESDIYKNNTENDSPDIIQTHKSKIKEIKKLNYLDRFLLKNSHKKTELDKSNLSNGNKTKLFKSKDEKKLQNSNPKKYNDLNEIKNKKNFKDNIGDKNKPIFKKESFILNNIQISSPHSKKNSKQKILKLNNFKEKFSKRYSHRPPSVYIKINKTKDKNNLQQLTDNNIAVNSVMGKKPKSMHKKFFLNNSSNKKINTENIFFKNDKNENNKINDNNINSIKNKKKKIKSNPKAHYKIKRQKSTNESYNLSKMGKIPKNMSKKNNNSLSFNPFNNELTNINNNIEKNNIKSIINICGNNNINNNNTNVSINKNNNAINNNIIPSINNFKIINEKELAKIKTSSCQFLKEENYNYTNNIYQKRKDRIFSNKDLIKTDSDETNYNYNLKRKYNYNDINNNNSCCSENNIYNNRNELNNFLIKECQKMKSIDLYINNQGIMLENKYNKKTYDSNSNDFAVCNTNSSLEEINKKLIGLSKEKKFYLTKINLKNYICTKNKCNSIKIEITAKGNINMMKIYYLEGKENITKELIKNIIFTIGF